MAAAERRTIDRGAIAVAIAVAAAACGDDGGGHDELDAGPTIDAAPSPCGELPSLAPPWLAARLDDVVARLSGERPIRTGVTLADRATAGARDEARAYLAAELEGLGLEVLVDDYGGGANVYAEIAPTEGAAASWLVIGAHFDGVPDSPAANDDATGVAAVLATARYVAELECRTRGVVVALFDQEEIGLVGSVAFADLLAAADLPIASVHTIDQLGWDADGDRAIELELPTTALFNAYRLTSQARELGIPVSATSTSTSDHQAFRAAGFAAVGLTEEYVGGDTTPHYHLPGDTYATVSFDYLASSVALVFAVIGGFAAGEAAPGVAPARDGDRGPGAVERLRRAAPQRPAARPLPGWRPRGSR